MDNNCQKMTEIVYNLQRMKRVFDVAFRDGTGDAGAAKEQQSLISAELKTKLVETPVTESRAEKILGSDFLGSRAIEAAFSGKVEIPAKIPPIPFNVLELEKAKELDQFLILRVNRTTKLDTRALFGLKRSKESHPLTMERISQFFQKTYKALFSRSVWDASEDYYKIDAPELGWALVSKEPLAGTFGMDYFSQIRFLEKYLVETVYEGRELPAEYKEAIADLDECIKNDFHGASDIEIIEKMVGERREACMRVIADLKINKLLRQSPVEVMYDMMVYHRTNGQELLRDIRTWTNRRASDGLPIYVGRFHDGTFLTDKCTPTKLKTAVGAVLSMRK
jgi:hypothetical protein